MTARKAAAIFAILILPTSSRAEPEKALEISTAAYEVKFENFGFFIRIGIALKGFDFLDWKEMQMEMASEYDPETSSRTIRKVSITHDQGKKILHS